VAETVNKRRGMMGELLLAVMLPQILLVLITGFHIWTGVNRGLSPLNDLAGMIARRSAKDFDPIPDVGVPLEVRSLTHTINALLQRLGSTLITQRRFIENVAHQLRTPLAGLKIQAERALSADNPDNMRQALQLIKNASNRLARLNTQLLVLARSESISRNAPEFRMLDLTYLARECCMEWVPRALECKMELGFDAPASAVEIYGDGIVLRELLGNLLDNAVNYGKAGGHIGVRVEAAPHARLIVEDDGPGIPAGEQDKIFERFYRIPGSSGEGCGLGLAIVKEIADLHAARVAIQSGLPGQNGTRIEIDFAAS
jgi:two-component system sensor histidine kinase TctE